MMDELTWELLTETNGRLEADLLKSFLEANGVPVELFQESVGQHIYPVTIDGLGRVQVFIPKANHAEGRLLLEQYQHPSE
jgi:hypothetical protein